MAVHEVIDNRRSNRKYQEGAEIADEQVRDLLRAAMLAPSAHNNRPWHFAVVRDRAALNALAGAHPYAKMMYKASLAIVVLADPTAGSDAALFFPQDCAAATMSILLQATAMGLGSCWCGVYPVESHMTVVRTHVKLPDHLTPFSLIAIGVPTEQPAQRGRYEEDKVLWL